MTTGEFTRRTLLRRAAATGALGAAAWAVPGLARADTPAVTHSSAQLGEIYELQAAFHRAASNQDIDLKDVSGATIEGKPVP